VKKNNQTNSRSTDLENSRRTFLKAAGKLAVYAPPAMIALMQPGTSAIARSPTGRRPRCNNGVGNGPDCLPPGLEKNGKTFLDNDDIFGTPGNPQNSSHSGSP
jgi:hypothetical protein